MKSAVRPSPAVSIPLVARLHVDLCRCTSAVCCRQL
ncbi:putative leader peptide [Streptomyces sp. NPDC097704]